MTLPLFNVRLDSRSTQLLADLQKVPAVQREVRKIARNAILEAADFAVMGAKSAVPVDTFELRGTDLDNGMIQKTPVSLSRLTCMVYVSNTTHYGRRNHPKSASSLALLLDSGKSENGRDMKRTKNSAAINKFGTRRKGSPTAGWIGQAQKSVLRGVRSYLVSRGY